MVNSMHCILEGLVYYHCCYVLGLDITQAKANDPVVPSFSYPWIPYSFNVPPEYYVKDDSEIKQVSAIHDILVIPFDCGPGSISPFELSHKLMNKKLSPLKFVCYTLGLWMEVCQQNCVVPVKMKWHFADLLVD
jgi:hypothetical protein